MEMPKVPASESMRFRAQLRTRWSDEDNQCVLNNAVYSTLLEETRYAYFTHLGLLAENHFPFLLAQTNIVFRAPGRGGAEIEAEVATVHLGTSSFTQAYRLRDLARGIVWCEAESRLVAWDNTRAEKMPRMPPAFRARLAEFEGLSAG